MKSLRSFVVTATVAVVCLSTMAGCYARAGVAAPRREVVVVRGR